MAFVGEGKWEFQVAAYMKTLGIGAPLILGVFNYRAALRMLGFHVSSDGKGWVTYAGPPSQPPAAASASASSSSSAGPHGAPAADIVDYV